MLIKINNKKHWFNGKLGFIIEQRNKIYTIRVENDALAYLTKSEFIILGWQPINSAPKDGTRILIKDNKNNIGIYYWDNEQKLWEINNYYCINEEILKEWKPIC